VDDGTFHDFHHAWTAEIRKALNGGVLPKGYYAQSEQVAFSVEPDILTLQRPNNGNGALGGGHSTGTVAVMAPPQTSFKFRAEINEYTARQREIVIRHARNHRIVALIEIVSPGNKSSDYAFTQLLTIVGGALYRGIHVLLLDLIPPTPRDPHGIHAAVWEALRAGTFLPPPERPLTLVSYEAGPIKAAFVEPIAVGQTLPAMPLFVEIGWHVPVPLEATYQNAWEGTPEYFRDILTNDNPEV
jgi:hypothetical protein